MRYVYTVEADPDPGFIYYSSWLKAFKYCEDRGCIFRGYDSKWITQMYSEMNPETREITGRVLTIRRELVL